MPDDPAPATPDALLRHAAAADAARAHELLERITATRLLDLVVTQAELAVEEDRPRPAGIDAIGDLSRAAVEIMELPQDLDLELEDDDPLAPPTVTGWELVTVPPDDLTAATLALPVSPWLLLLIAFVDAPGPDGRTIRSVVAAAADGRLVRARLRMVAPHEDADVLLAAVVRDPGDLADDARLATALLAALRSAARGG